MQTQRLSTYTPAQQRLILALIAAGKRAATRQARAA
jgi:uncharacterized protein YdeI (YjbR/CyaY-like superfamily)